MAKTESVQGDSDTEASTAVDDERDAEGAEDAVDTEEAEDAEGEAVDADADADGVGASGGTSHEGGSWGPAAGPAAMAASSGRSDAPPRGEAVSAKSARRAHLTLSRVEPWSVMKFSFVISLVCFIILFVAVAVVYAILSGLGVFDAITDLITSLTDGGEEDDLGLNPAAWFSPSRVLGYTGLIGALNIILITALSTIGAMLYNLAADLVGGLDITLSESE